jgi:hypothetical protein
MEELSYLPDFPMFSSDLRPQVKSDGPWWKKEKECVSIGADEEYSDCQKQLFAVMMETAMEVRPKVKEIKSRFLRRDQ